MPSPQQMESLRTLAVRLASQHQPQSEAVETLSEMILGLDLGPSDDVERMAIDIFNSPEMEQHLENLAMSETPFPRLRQIQDLTELRSALLL